MSEFDAERYGLNPANIATEAAYNVAHQHAGGFMRHVVRISDFAQDCDFTERDFAVEASRGVVVPEEHAAPSAQIRRFSDVSIDGRFMGYSHLVLDVMSVWSYQDPSMKREIHALCMMFDQAMFIPTLDELPEDSLLHIPVLAVDDIQKKPI